MTHRVLFYVQHILGIGHLSRAARLVAAMSDAGIEVTVALGGVPVNGIDWSGARIAELPAITSGAGGYADLVTVEGKPLDDVFREHRRDTLLSLFDDVAPDVLITEAFPFGRRAMRFELLPLLERARAMDNGPVTGCSIRDILHENRKPGLNEKTVGLLDRYFDFVFVHGDESFIALKESFPLAHTIAPAVRHTGIVSAGSDGVLTGKAYDVVVSAGGGAVGELLLMSAAEALAGAAAGALSCALVTGPNLAQSAADRLRDAAAPNIAIETFRADFPALLKHARLSISQCGYNTAADVLRARCRAVFVPSAYQGETEQTRRAGLLKERGLAQVVPEAELSRDTLAAAIDAALQSREPDWSRAPDLDGAARFAAMMFDAGSRDADAVV